MRYVAATLILLCGVYHCVHPVTSFLTQFPAHSCFQEDVTFVCSTDKPANPQHLLNLAISVLHSPAIDTSRLIHSNAYTDSTRVSQNLTIQSLSPSEAPAGVVCVSILWSNESNAFISTQIESNTSILVPSHPAAISGISLEVLNETAFMLDIRHDGVVHREDLLSYAIEISTSLNQFEFTVSYSNLADQEFSVSSLFDTCYKMVVNTTNCVGDTRYFSTTLYLPKLGNETLTRVSQTEFCWNNQAANTACPGPYFVDFTQQNMFTVFLIQNNNVLENITSYTVNLPTEFCFSLPDQFLAPLNPIYLRILLEGIPLTTMDILIPVNDLFPTITADNTNRVVTIASSAAGAILLLVLLVFLLVTVVCVFTLVRRRRRRDSF